MTTAHASRQLVIRFVMVGDDQVDTELAGAARPSGARMPQSTDTISLTPSAWSDRGAGLQAVAIGQPLRNEMPDVRAKQLERAPQDPVDVMPSTS